MAAWRGHELIEREDHVAAEEPLEIRLAGFRIAVTMRTPGDDFDLVTGFLLTEGILDGPDQIASVAYCPDPDLGPEAAGNVVNGNLVDPAHIDPSRWQRHGFRSSSCGVCGKAALEMVRLQCAPIEDSLLVEPEVLYRMAETLSHGQAVFARTGGLHAAGLFDRGGQLKLLREDIGRHNAVDKVIGGAVRSGTPPLGECVLMVSGRASFEVVQKALVARVPVVAAVSAPSSLAVDLAREANMTLIGFLRRRRFNVYAGPLLQSR